MRPSKRIQEKAILDRFLSCPKHPITAQNILQPQNDPPDFTLEINGTSVSVEVTQLIDSKQKKVERFEDDIVHEAHERFKASFPHVELYVLVIFKNVHLKGRAFIETYSEDVLNIIVEAYQENKHNKKFDLSLRNKKQFNSNIIDTCHVRASPNFDHWQTFGAHLVPPIESETIVKIIHRKENALKKYQNNFDENWLLIVCELGPKSSSFHVHSKIYLETIFDKVFLLEYMPHDIITIK